MKKLISKIINYQVSLFFVTIGFFISNQIYEALIHETILDSIDGEIHTVIVITKDDTLFYQRK